MAEFTSEKIMRMVQEYVRETLNNDEKCRAISGPTSDGTTTLPGLTILESSDMKSEEATSLLKSVNRWLMNQDHSLMRSLTEKLIAAEDSVPAPDSDIHRTMSRELLKAFQSVLQVRIKRSLGDYSVSDEELVPMLKQEVQVKPVQIPVQNSEPVPKVHGSLPFTELQDRYIAEVEKAESWTEKTKAENLSIFALFVRAMGDMDVNQINRQVMSEYKSLLMQLPPNLNKGNKYQGMELKEIIASKPKETLTVNTINKYMRRLSGVLNYAVKNGYMPSNPAEGIQIRSHKRADQEREAYTTEDLKQIFHSEEYREGKHRASYAYWTPYIALYSGCRLEEICQLHLEDIRQEGGVWVFDINDKKEKRVKTRSSARLVPVHTHLIQLGLLDHVETLKAKGDRSGPEKLNKPLSGKSATNWADEEA